MIGLVVFSGPMISKGQERPVARLVSTLGSVENTEKPKSRRIATLTPDAASNGASDIRKVERPGTLPGLSDATSIERQAFEATNAIRAKSGLAPLVWEPELCLLARNHSENMARMNFFGHETPAGMRLRDRARAAGIRGWRILAENIAYNQGYNEPGTFAVERWMVSPGHRANILDRTFQGVALGSFIAADGRVYITQVFISRLMP